MRASFARYPLTTIASIGYLLISGIFREAFYSLGLFGIENPTFNRFVPGIVLVGVAFLIDKMITRRS